jgi:hypothetical protein
MCQLVRIKEVGLRRLLELVWVVCGGPGATPCEEGR